MIVGDDGSLGTPVPAGAAKPRFSVVTVVRNDKDGLRRTRDSLLGQTFAGWEWIIQDGASTDGTAEYAASLRSVQVRVRSEADAGIYDAMNRGLRAAEGDWIIFMNAGDRFCCGDVLARLCPDRLDGCDIVFGETIMDFGFMVARRRVRDASYIWHGQPGMHQSTLVLTRYHQRFEFDPAFRVSADYDVIARMMAAGARCRSVDIAISTFEFRPDATSNRNKLRMLIEAARVQRVHLKSSSWRIAVSAARRSAASIAARVLTGARRFGRR